MNKETTLWKLREIYRDITLVLNTLKHIDIKSEKLERGVVDIDLAVDWTVSIIELFESYIPEEHRGLKLENRPHKEKVKHIVHYINKVITELEILTFAAFSDEDFNTTVNVNYSIPKVLKAKNLRDGAVFRLTESSFWMQKEVRKYNVTTEI